MFLFFLSEFAFLVLATCWRFCLLLAAFPTQKVVAAVCSTFEVVEDLVAAVATADINNLRVVDNYFFIFNDQ